MPLGSPSESRRGIAIAVLGVAMMGCSTTPTGVAPSPGQSMPLGAPGSAQDDVVRTVDSPRVFADGCLRSDPRCVYTRASIRERARTVRTMGDYFDGAIAGIKVNRSHSPTCDDWIEMKGSDFERYEAPIPEDIPRGWVVKEPSGWLCGRSPMFVARIVEFEPGIAFGVSRAYSEDTLRARAGETLVSRGVIQGRPAVFIRPLSRQGSGNSWVAFKDGRDLITLKGTDVRFTILRRAAESLRL